MREFFGVRVPLRWCLLVVGLLLLVLPVGLYWNTTWTEFGLRDDYGVVREAREEPMSIVRFCGSHARPVFGWLLRVSFAHIDHIREIAWARLAGSTFIGLFTAYVAVVLVRLHGWSLTTAACLSATLAFVPAAQVVAGWGILWPYLVAALFSTSAFVAAELGFRASERLSFKQVLWCGLSALFVVASMWVYQPNGLFYLVFVAVKAVRRGDLLKPAPRVRLLQHLLLFGGAMLLAYVLIRLAFALDWLPMSKRIAFEHDPLGKLGWFLKNSLPNALALFVLNDFHGRTAPWYQLAAIATSALLLAGGLLVTKRRGWREGAIWFGGLVVLTVGAHGINLMVAERWPSYRTIHPLTGVILVYAAASIEVLGETLGWIKRIRFFVALAVIATAAILARRQVFELIAKPQNRELQLVEQEAQKLDVTRDQKVYVITPTPEIAPARLVYSDEFGSLSTDSDWVPKEILKLYFYDKHPELPPCRSLDHMVSGEKPPPPGVYDVVLDLRGLGKVQ